MEQRHQGRRIEPREGPKRGASGGGQQDVEMQVDEATGIEGPGAGICASIGAAQGEAGQERAAQGVRAATQIFTPVVEHMKLQIRFNMKARQVELRVGPETPDIANLQRGADFVRAFLCGFEVDDALALLRLEDLFVESFEIKDVKTLRGDHQSRAIGRLAGKGGRTKFTIENVTKTRIVLADSKIHILGSYQNIQLARRAVCNLILGSPPSKVYSNLRSVASRLSERM
ncbi:GM23025 [Drosophila sechellia]|uniref:GM23025 n=1 Tax=Drosophila sechellia TaxID=7238 RepID=B4I669_DROSE|nr:GM23025 [Drosophila sechellia]